MTSNSVLLVLFDNSLLPWGLQRAKELGFQEALVLVVLLDLLVVHQVQVLVVLGSLLIIQIVVVMEKAVDSLLLLQLQ